MTDIEGRPYLPQYRMAWFYLATSIIVLVTSCVGLGYVVELCAHRHKWPGWVLGLILLAVAVIWPVVMLVDPPPGIDFGIQRGGGADCETLFVQQCKQEGVIFDFSLTVTENQKDGQPNFKGPFTQGPPATRFIHIDVGTHAGQKDTEWSRRMKVPLQGITWELIKQTRNKPGRRLLARIPGKHKDGGPNCATVKLLGHWEVINAATKQGTAF